MPEIEKIMEVIIPYLATGLVIIITIVLLINKRITDRSIVKLYMEGKYDEANQKLNSIKKIALGASKQWYNYHEALILIANEDYLLADKILKNLKSKKMEKYRLFWLCFIHINLKNLDLVNQYYELIDKLTKKEDLENKILISFIEHMHDKTKKMDVKIFEQLKNPVLIKYIKDETILE